MIKIIVKGLLTGFSIAIWILLIVFWVTAFETLWTTPWTVWNQSLWSQILSKLSAWWFDRTTDSLEAISDKIDWIWSGWVTWAWYTTVSYNWAMWGSYWMNTKCDTDYSWSKAMTYDDWLDLWVSYPNTSTAWIIDWSFLNGNYQASKDWLGFPWNANVMCISWTSTNSGHYWPNFDIATWRITALTCNTTHKIPCVYK